MGRISLSFIAVLVVIILIMTSLVVFESIEICIHETSLLLNESPIVACLLQPLESLPIVV